MERKAAADKAGGGEALFVVYGYFFFWTATKRPQGPSGGPGTVEDTMGRMARVGEWRYTGAHLLGRYVLTPVARSRPVPVCVCLYVGERRSGEEENLGM